MCSLFLSSDPTASRSLDRRLVSRALPPLLPAEAALHLGHCRLEAYRRAGRPPESDGFRPGCGLRAWREYSVLRLDGLGRAFSARCGRSARLAVTMERYQCPAPVGGVAGAHGAQLAPSRAIA